MANWTLNGISIGSSSTTVVVTAQRQQRRSRTATQGLLDDGEYVESAGRDKGRVTLTFACMGVGDDKFDTAARIAGIIENNATWTLAAPEGESVKSWRALSSARFKAEGDVSVEQQNRIRVDVNVSAVFLSEADVAPVESQLEVTLLTNDSYATSDAASFDGKARVWLPTQATHYPMAQDTTTGRFEAIAGSWTYTASEPDGTTATITSYAIDGYTHGAPFDDGEGGPAVLKRRDA